MLSHNETVLYRIFFKYKRALSLDELVNITKASKSKLKGILYPSSNFSLSPDKRWYTDAVEYENKLVKLVPLRIINLYYPKHPFISVEEYITIFNEIDSIYEHRTTKCYNEINDLKNKYHAKRYLENIDELLYLRDQEYSLFTQRIIELDTVVNDIYNKLVIRKQWAKYSNILYCNYYNDVDLIVNGYMNNSYYGLLEELKQHPFHESKDDESYKTTRELENAVTNKPLRQNVDNINSPSLTILSTCTGNCSTCEREFCINDK